MDPHLICLLLFLSASVFLNLEQTATAGEGIIGASFVDNNTRIGKEEMVAMEMAIEDICNQTNHCLALQVKDSQGEAALATLAGMLCRFSYVNAVNFPFEKLYA